MIIVWTTGGLWERIVNLNSVDDPLATVSAVFHDMCIVGLDGD
jgi:hypothetical protein